MSIIYKRAQWSIKAKFVGPGVMMMMMKSVHRRRAVGKQILAVIIHFSILSLRPLPIVVKTFLCYLFLMKHAFQCFFILERFSFIFFITFICNQNHYTS